MKVAGMEGTIPREMARFLTTFACYHDIPVSSSFRGASDLSSPTGVAVVTGETIACCWDSDGACCGVC
jgi:hypothetical protein